MNCESDPLPPYMHGWGENLQFQQNSTTLAYRQCCRLGRNTVPSRLFAMAVRRVSEYMVAADDPADEGPNNTQALDTSGLDNPAAPSWSPSVPTERCVYPLFPPHGYKGMSPSLSAQMLGARVWGGR